jgi:hypothetical protein
MQHTNSSSIVHHDADDDIKVPENAQCVSPGVLISPNYSSEAARAVVHQIFAIFTSCCFGYDIWLGDGATATTRVVAFVLAFLLYKEEMTTR